MGRRHAIDRAFELARTGAYAIASDIRSALSGEGYSAAQLEPLRAPSLRRDLIRACREAGRGERHASS